MEKRKGKDREGRMEGWKTLNSHFPRKDYLVNSELVR